MLLNELLLLNELVKADVIYAVQQNAVRQHTYKLEQRVIYILSRPLLGTPPDQSMCNLPYRLVACVENGHIDVQTLVILDRSCAVPSNIKGCVAHMRFLTGSRRPCTPE